MIFFDAEDDTLNRPKERALSVKKSKRAED